MGAGHDHSHHTDTRVSRMVAAAAILSAFFVLELVTALKINSIALLADAGHMLTDAAAIGLSLAAVRLAQRPAKGAMTYGFKRVEILSAQANGVTLLVLALFITYEAITRLVTPPSVHANLMLYVALLGVAVNLVATWTLARANRQSLNVEGSFQHILTDLYAFIGTAIAAAVILATGFDRADPIASLLVAGLMLRSAYGLLMASGRVFLEAAPTGLDPDTIGRAMAATVGVDEVHDLHVWEISSGFPALSAHVLVTNGTDPQDTRRALSELLHHDFEIEHTTLQVEPKAGDLVTIASPYPRCGPAYDDARPQ